MLGLSYQLQGSYSLLKYFHGATLPAAQAVMLAGQGQVGARERLSPRGRWAQPHSQGSGTAPSCRSSGTPLCHSTGVGCCCVGVGLSAPRGSPALRNARCSRGSTISLKPRHSPQRTAASAIPILFLIMKKPESSLERVVNLYANEPQAHGIAPLRTLAQSSGAAAALFRSRPDCYFRRMTSVVSWLRRCRTKHRSLLSPRTPQPPGTASPR